MRIFRQPYFAASAIGLSVVSICLAGCSAGIAPLPSVNSNAITGNWQISSSAAVASRLPLLSGALTGSVQAITGIFHSGSTAACVSPTTAIHLAGSENAKSVVTLSGPIAGGTLSITGDLAEDGKTLTDAAYNVVGGACAFTAQAPATAQSFSPVNGTYAGTFSDSNGPVISITATLTQSPEADTDGNFLLSGTGAFGNNDCFNSPISVTNSQVTGGSFSLTYTDPNLNNSVTTTGTISTDASTVTITNWTLTGPCGSDSGTGIFTRQ